MATERMQKAMASLRRYIWFGTFTIAMLFGGVAGWAALAEISGGVIAPGMIVVEGSSKKVQHLEGGIVDELLVDSSQLVKAGQVLVRLDDSELRANQQIIESQMAELSARKARLRAERDDRENLEIPVDFSDQNGRSIWMDQKRLFEARRGARTDKSSQLLERVSQLEQAILGLDAQLSSKVEQIGYISDELSSLKILEEKQLVSRPRILALEREKSRLEGERGQLTADIARTRVQITETKLQHTEFHQTFLSEVVSELRDVEAKLLELTEKNTAVRIRLDRLEVRAPISGIVHNLSVFTVGGVVGSGETIMEIVPQTASLVIEARVEPQLIDQVNVGQEARVRFTAFDLHTTPELDGVVHSVSADVRQDSPQQPPYYAARVSVDSLELQKLEGKRLLPGMPVEVMMRRGYRTVLSYLVKPIIDNFNHALRER